MSNEKDNFKNPERGYNADKLKDLGNEQRERLREDIERKVEKKHENRESDARHEALEQASKAEKERRSHEKKIEQSPAEKRARPTSKREKEAAYKRTMKEVQTNMSASSRAFSKVIHTPAVEKVSDVVGATIARPNAILFGSLFAFLFTLGLYMIARMNGYSLSGAETIAAFALGWLVGIIVDYLKLLVLGKR